MRIVRYATRDGARRGVLVGDVVHSAAPDLSPGAVVGRLDSVTLLAPCSPRMIVCAGSNYVGQLAEKGLTRPERPMLFLKAPNAVTGPDTAVLRPSELRRLEYEGELAVVIGRTARAVPPDQVEDVILGYTCANDVTAADWRADGQWARAKSADTFCPLGPWIETDVGDPQELTITTRLEDLVVQQAPTSEMVFGVRELVAYATRWFTLQAGDVLLTGSPAGVGPIVPGDIVEVEISGIGTLRNTVTAKE
ncbi:fumarylacetoacetate hydrolase family protein [Actinocrispum wychmicini]|uniref:2-keto-4-pentenoate hydratase/2-oxohepta-3-ene-1,7-dioic acid hydratase in catechol pathway n=1 Tax=Actinocrispum wychmicini TaxID=1213861 RepID=A0A4R2JUD8_9PSEU|nr:fumarylacetoacetate hydrolase family protein [Actinocrispum wychmicini]TCO60639.1 2-keto-4-pentenoate hydratase/2-oxohepta-3-ene-1,7-dioic acid hydratase in catechol pathway [Actinocrispum wychmicini]